MFFSQCLAITVRFKEFVSVSPLKKMRAPNHTEGGGGANDDKERWLTWLSVSFLFFCFLFWTLLRMMMASYLRDDWWWMALVEYWVGGWGKPTGWEQVGLHCRSAAAHHHVRRVNHTNDTWALERRRNASFEETVQLLNAADKLLSPVWNVQQNSNATCKKIKNKKDQRISHSAGGVKSRVNLLNSISTLVNFKDEFPLLILAAFSTAVAALTLTRLRTSTKHFS